MNKKKSTEYRRTATKRLFQQEQRNRTKSEKFNEVAHNILDIRIREERTFFLKYRATWGTEKTRNSARPEKFNEVLHNILDIGIREEGLFFLDYGATWGAVCYK
ncbi:hypothetical protein GWI33_015215 [Rhynchophorus ferrugineus]|uniref:Uncharacterized protein n=1 Tax=Rhynchophorus ferrugineus TaxID=354439 RepID=A0A834MBN3_RHYFE|nr:hypothetical protein GWI33_015215 [Rhynchophorus ferrugineus]